MPGSPIEKKSNKLFGAKTLLLRLPPELFSRATHHAKQAAKKTEYRLSRNDWLVIVISTEVRRLDAKEKRDQEGNSKLAV